MIDVKRELKILFDIFLLFGSAIVMMFIVNFMGFPVTFDSALLICVLCRVARMSVEIKEKTR